MSPRGAICGGFLLPKITSAGGINSKVPLDSKVPLERKTYNDLMSGYIQVNLLIS